MSRPRIGIVGASGYTGSELVRILRDHGGVELGPITSERFSGKLISDIHPHLTDMWDRPLIPASEVGDHDLDLIFLALPHGVSMKFLSEHRDRDWRIVDLSGDCRLSSAAVYERWYEMEHVYPEIVEKAVYGLPEIFREEIARARLVANPGCYPTSAILGLWPLVREGLIRPRDIFVDSKSGVTGAGAKAKPVTHYPSVNEDIMAYKVGTHRHTPEIEEVLSTGSGGKVSVLFTPHLAPFNRGILTTIYCKPVEGIGAGDVKGALEKTYKDEPFIRLLNSSPTVQAVRGSNFCDLHALLDERSGNVVSIAAIDNLVKGAAGQAVQNMNIMLGLDERQGMDTVPLSP